MLHRLAASLGMSAGYSTNFKIAACLGEQKGKSLAKGSEGLGSQISKIFDVGLWSSHLRRLYHRIMQFVGDQSVGGGTFEMIFCALPRFCLKYILGLTYISKNLRRGLCRAPQKHWARPVQTADWWPVGEFETSVF